MTMFKPMTPSTEASWPYLQPADETEHSSTIRNSWSRIVAGARKCRAALAEHRRIRRASGELERLDDRMLSDIGVRRCEIGRVVRYGRGF